MTVDQQLDGDTALAGADRRVVRPQVAAAVSWPLTGPPARSGWRLFAAAGAVTEASAHIPVTKMHLHEAPYIGIGFVLLTVAGFLLAQLLLIGDSRAVWVCTAVAGLHSGRLDTRLARLRSEPQHRST